MAAAADSHSSTKLTKAQIVESIYEEVPVSKRNIQRVIDLFVDEIKQGLGSNKTVELRGFGTFEIKERKGRRARNPRTRSAIPVGRGTFLRLPAL